MAIPHSNQKTSDQPAKGSKNPFNAFYNSTFAITWDIGVVMIIIAICGIFDPHFLGLNLGFMHCFVLTAFGLLSIYSGVTTRDKSYKINLITGLFFLLNSVLGFLVGDRGHLKLGYGTTEDVMVRFAPGFLELSTFDHILHFVLAFFMLLEAYSWKRKSLDFPDNLRTRPSRKH